MPAGHHRHGGMPRMSASQSGQAGVRAYAARSGQTEEAYLSSWGSGSRSGRDRPCGAWADPGDQAPGYLLTEPDCRRCHEYRRGRLPRRATSEISTPITHFKKQMPHGGEWREHHAAEQERVIYGAEDRSAAR